MLTLIHDCVAHERFFSLVDVSGDCWLWTGALGPKGFGMFSVGGRYARSGKRRNSMVFAHRFAYTMHNGPIPAGQGHHGNCVLHRCLNHNCVNPAHLYLGTALDSVRSMDARGRRVNAQLVGDAHWNAKLSVAKVLEIKAMLADGVLSQKRIAEIYGVVLSTINHIKTGRLWSHIEDKK